MIGTTPFTSDFVSLRDAMDRLFAESFVSSPFRTLWSQGGNWAGGAYPLPLDVYATGDEVVLIAAVPGARPEDVEVSINQGTVTLTGKLANAAEAEDAKRATWYLHELWYGPFQRTVSLPMEVDAAKAEAIFADGILKIRLPKAEQAKPRKIEVRVAEPAAPQAVGAGSETK